MESAAIYSRGFMGACTTFSTGEPLYRAIVHAAREHGLAGATVLHGALGFGANSRIQTAKILRLSEDLPIVIEILDQADRIAEFLPVLDEMITEGLVTLEPVRVIAYRHSEKGVQTFTPQRAKGRRYSPAMILRTISAFREYI